MTEKVVGWLVRKRVNGRVWYQKVAADMMPSFPETQKEFERTKYGEPMPLTEADWTQPLTKLEGRYAERSHAGKP